VNWFTGCTQIRHFVMAITGSMIAQISAHTAACGYSKLTWKLRTRRLSQLNLNSSSATMTPEDYRQLAERCALLAFECAAPGVAEELRTLAVDYLTRAVSPMARSSSDDRL
jgi:hypothetical protein